MNTHIWFRAETKPGEERAALTPGAAKTLIDAGFRITVEESANRAFPIDEYQAIGCEIAAAHSWQSSETDAIVLGLKELESADFPLIHRHIHFAHVFKQQKGWTQVLNRFTEGNGTLYDLEYLVDESGRRIAAFGYWAGFAGTALAVQAWCGLNENKTPILSAVKSRPGQRTLVSEIDKQLAGLLQDANFARPRILVIGAKGRSGRGAVQACKDLGLDVTEWDIAETQSGGPFPQILEFDILVNCVFVQQPMPPFVDQELLQRSSRKLSVICDVSCDPYGDYNPLPIYDRCTTFQQPTLEICDGPRPLHLIAIDHLPSLLPVESSLDYCEQLLPALLKLNDLDSPIWKRAEQLFLQKSRV